MSEPYATFDASGPFHAIFDNTNMNWNNPPFSQHNELFLKAQENWFNDLLRARGHVFVNEVLGGLGIPHKPQGQLEGWIYSDGVHIDFGCWDQNFEGDSIELKLNSQGVMYDKIPNS